MGTQSASHRLRPPVHHLMTTGFYDSFLLRLDDKGRLVLPASFRRAFEERPGHVVWRGRYLALYPDAQWQEFRDAIRAQVAEGLMTATEAGVFFARSAEVSPDKQGRITLSRELRATVGMNHEVRCAGFDSHIALWDEARWQEHLGTVEAPAIEDALALSEKAERVAFL